MQETKDMKRLTVR